MPPLVLIGGAFILWITSKNRLQLYSDLAKVHSNGTVTANGTTTSDENGHGATGSW